MILFKERVREYLTTELFFQKVLHRIKKKTMLPVNINNFFCYLYFCTCHLIKNDHLLKVGSIFINYKKRELIGIKNLIYRVYIIIKFCKCLHRKTFYIFHV